VASPAPARRTNPSGDVAKYVVLSRGSDAAVRAGFQRPAVALLKPRGRPANGCSAVQEAAL